MTAVVPQVSFDARREEFPVLRDWAYLNSAARGLLRQEVVDAHVRYLRDQLTDGGTGHLKRERAAAVTAVRGQLATLLNARPDEIAFTKNITEGLNIIAQGLRSPRGSNVVVTPDLEHPTLVWTMAHLRDSGVDVRCAAARAGAYDIDAIVGLIDDRTSLVATSAISFVTGARADLNALSEVCHSRGAVLLVDGAQSLGTMNLDVRQLGIDAIAGSSQKGLLGLHGLGFLYCSRDLADRINPVYLGRTSIDLDDERQFILGDLDHYGLAPGAPRFETGHLNYPAIYGFRYSLEYLLGIGIPAIEAWTADLSDQLLDRLTDLGMVPVTPVERRRRGSVACVRSGDPEQITRELHRANVSMANRRGILRFGFHAYNTPADVDRVVEVLSAMPESVRTAAAE